MNQFMAIGNDKPQRPTHKGGLIQSVKDFGSLLWRFSKKLMWFSSTSKTLWTVVVIMFLIPLALEIHFEEKQILMKLA